MYQSCKGYQSIKIPIIHFLLQGLENSSHQGHLDIYNIIPRIYKIISLKISLLTGASAMVLSLFSTCVLAVLLSIQLPVYSLGKQQRVAQILGPHHPHGKFRSFSCNQKSSATAGVAI